MWQQIWQQHHRWMQYVPWLALVLLLIYGLIGPQGIFRLRSLAVERARFEASIKEKERENLRLRQEVYQLHHDPSFVEKLAREELGFVREGEVVYQFKD